VESHESPTVNFHPDVAARAVFGAAMTKSDLVATDRLLLGINSFEPGQSQRVHEHASADKFYLVLSGKARIVVGDDTYDAKQGDLVFAPAGMAHGVATAHERTVLLVGMTR
jgi:quercetin dioxygenase-like cupin family protein